MELLRILSPIRQLRIIVLTPQQFRAPHYYAAPVTIWQQGNRTRFLTWSGDLYTDVKPLQQCVTSRAPDSVVVQFINGIRPATLRASD
jgi:hypothetical protein